MAVKLVCAVGKTKIERTDTYLHLDIVMQKQNIWKNVFCRKNDSQRRVLLINLHNPHWEKHRILTAKLNAEFLQLA